MGDQDFFGQKLKGSFVGGRFAKGCEFLLVSWGRVQLGGGGRFSCGNKGKGEGSGGWGRDRQRNRQVNAQALSKLPFSKLPLGSQFPLREYKIPPPPKIRENFSKITINLAHPEPVLKITEKFLESATFR